MGRHLVSLRGSGNKSLFTLLFLLMKDPTSKSGNSLLASVTVAPSVVLWAVDQVDVTIRCNCYWGQTSSFSVGVQTFQNQHFVFDVFTFVSVPRLVENAFSFI